MQFMKYAPTDMRYLVTVYTGILVDKGLTILEESERATHKNTDDEAREYLH